MSQAALAFNASPASTFKFDSHPVRIVLRDGGPWFVAVDVCRALEIQNASQVIGRLDDDERAMFNIGRQGDVNLVNESGLYTLILRCRDAVKPGTVPHRFRKWVTAEVLPAIRKTGRYEAPAAPTSRDLALSLLEKTRWMLTVQNGYTVLIDVGPGAVIVKPDEIASLIQRRDGYVPLNLIPEILAASVGRLGASGLFNAS